MCCSENHTTGQQVAAKNSYFKNVSFKTDRIFYRCVDPTVSCYRFLDLSGPLYIGGLPLGIRAQQFRVKGVSFVGCMKQLYIDNELTDFGKYVLNRGTEPGCKHLQDVCHNRPCLHAKRCVNVWNGFQCDCSDGYGGKNCSDGNNNLFFMINILIILYIFI